MRKKFVSAKDAINVYDFMRMCGLECVKTKTKISHEIMMRKLNLRNEKFPQNVNLPKRLSFDDIRSDEVATGNILIVEDDYNKILYYKNPKMFSLNCLLNELKESVDDLESIRRKILKKELNKIKELGCYLTATGDVVEEKIEEDTITEKNNRQKQIVRYGKRGIVQKY